MQHRTPSNQHGFTIIELLIATTVFSVILMVAASVLIQVGRMYYKGVITSKTQNVTRTVMDDVSRTIQFSDGVLSSAHGTSPDRDAYCVGTTRYTYILKKQVKSDPQNTSQTRHGLWQDTVAAQACADNLPDLQVAVPSSGGRELLEENMRLQTFDIATLGSDDLYRINTKVIYGDDDLLNNPTDPTSCKGAIVGGQWCAISALSTVVYSRARTP